MIDTTATFTRQHDLFDPPTMRPRLGRIGLVGCGAIGSAFALVLAKMGIVDFDVYDHDTVEIHNVPNQLLYGYSDRNEPKVVVALDHIQRLVHGSHFPVPSTVRVLDIEGHARRATRRDIAKYDTVIVATDSLASRQMLWTAAFEAKRPARYLDMRMGGRVASCYAVTLHTGQRVARDAERYMEVTFKTPADHDPCGARSFLPTALIAASLGGLAVAAWARGETPPAETYLSFECTSEPYIIHTRGSDE